MDPVRVNSRSLEYKSMAAPAACARRARGSATLQCRSDLAGAGASAVQLSVTRTFQLGLIAGAVAGLTVDVILFPLDTLKTRLQIAGGPGGRRALFTGIYKGFLPALAASAPSAAAFFGSYDYSKRILEPYFTGTYAPLAHMLSAAVGDVAGSTVRVPFEVVKQRVQSGLHATPSSAVRAILAKEGVGGLFTGYASLVVRELPFDAIQFPMYEFLKARWAAQTGRLRLETWENSICGSAAGAVAAAVTTPLDVVKTRLMTQAGAVRYNGIVHGLRRIAREEGPRALFAGITPRVMWISLGGAIFFGAYEAARARLFPVFVERELEEKAKKV